MISVHINTNVGGRLVVLLKLRLHIFVFTKFHVCYLEVTGLCVVYSKIFHLNLVLLDFTLEYTDLRCLKKPLGF